jgi:uncharacterized protein Yka (UPF0111/DUF47 family)
MNDSFMQNTFLGYVSNGKIITSYNQHIGYTVDEYNKVLDTAKQYQQVLYDKGILEKPKTPEEINKEMQQTLAKAQEMIASMSSTISELNTKLGREQNVKQNSNPERSK